MKSLYDIFHDYLSGRAKTRIYYVFFMWLALFHIHIIFTALFVSQDLIFKKEGLLKGEYIYNRFIHPESLWFWVYEVGTIVVATGLTYVFIWILPKTLLKKAYTQEVTDEYDRKEIKLNKELDLQKIRTRIEKSKLTQIQAKQEIGQKIESTEKKADEAWSGEYEDFAKSELYKDFPAIVESVFERRGSTKVESSYDSTVYFAIPVNLLSYATTNKLVIFNSKDKTIDLTEKGEYYIKRFQESTR